MSIGNFNVFSGGIVVNFEEISHIAMMSPLLNLASK